jgi:hypothetical protein
VTAVAIMLAGSVAAAACAASAPLLFQFHPPGREGLAASARADRLPERCPKLGRILRPLDRSCVIAGEGAPVTLLVGDSHADVLKRILGQEIEKRGGTLRLMNNHSGIFTDLAKWTQREAVLSHVDTFSERLLRPEDVVREAELRNATKIVLHARADHLEIEGVRQLARLSRARNIQVDVLLPVPGPNFNVPARLYKAAESDAVPPVAMDWDYNTLPEADQRELFAAAESMGNLRIFDPTKYLCHPKCLIADDRGRPYYSDDQHLTQTGVERIRPILAAMSD